MAIVYKHPTAGLWVIAKSAKNSEKDSGFIKAMQEKGIPYKVVKKIPSLRQLEKWSDDGVCPAPDGCRVEPDGTCQHGFPSWLMVLGFI